MLPESNQTSSLFSIIESGLDLAGKQSKDIILNYIEYRYGLSADSIAKHKDEFENYIREILGESAEIIISRINRSLKESGEKKQENQGEVGDEPSRCCTDGVRQDNILPSTGSTVEEAGGQQQQQTLLLEKRQSARGAGKKRTRLSDKIHFLICDNCFWSASFLTLNYQLKCMTCSHDILSAVPIASKESFTMDMDPKRGISLFFR